MKIIEMDVYEPRIFCPSTDEDILKSHEARFNKKATALKGCWSYELADEPFISQPSLQEAWDRFYESHMSKQADTIGMKLYAAWIHFLKGYDAPDWVAYELTFHGTGCGPVSFTQLYVVQGDTVVDDLSGDLMRANDMDDEAFCDEATDGRSNGSDIWRIEPFDTAE